VPKDVALALFRVLQEALTNAVKHAGVSHVNVALRGCEDTIELEVVDTGIGFDPVAALRAHGLGLVSMQERLNLVHGEFAIDSRPGAGTGYSLVCHSLSPMKCRLAGWMKCRLREERHTMWFLTA
jgi:signal transduction histidine kinase